jgi:hypothetical protein
MPPQVSLYIDRILYMEIKSIAEKKKVPVSRYVSDTMREQIDKSWPDEFFESLGTIDDETFEIPEELPWSLDSPRETL